MKRIFFISLFTLIAIQTFAKDSSKIWQAFEQAYQPAENHRGLISPHEGLDTSKIKSYVVVLKGGIPSERAPFYISWEDYDYRGVTIDGDEIKTRRGAIYTYLQKGDVLAVAGIDHLGKTLYLKLISPDIYVPENRSQEKRHSRVTVMLGYKLPKDVYKVDDSEKALALVNEWLKPFTNLDDAKAFAANIK